MSKRKKPPPRKKRADELREMFTHAQQLQRVQQQAQALTDDGLPPGHPLRALMLLMSGDAGRAQHVFETTQEILGRSRK